MKILVVSQYYYPEPFRLNEICEDLVRIGHEVTVVTGQPNYPDGEIYPGYENKEKHETINGVSVIRCKITPRKAGNKNLALNYLSFMFSAENTLKHLDGEFDVIYGYQLSPITSMIPAERYAKSKKIPFFLYCLDIWPESVEAIFNRKSIAYRIVERISKNIYISADTIGVTSPCFCEYLSNLIGDQCIIHYIPQHAADLLPDIQATANALPPKKETVDFVFIGNVGSSQNIEGVLRALSKVEDKTKIRLHIIGSGSSLENVENECGKLGLNGYVTFYGRKPKTALAQYYQMADVCIVSLRKEGLVGNTVPGKLQEYMSAGKAILAFIDGDAASVVNRARCGVAVPAEDEQRLSEAFTEFLDEKQDEVWGNNARAFYEANYTLAHHTNALVAELEILCKRK